MSSERNDVWKSESILVFVWILEMLDVLEYHSHIQVYLFIIIFVSEITDVRSAHNSPDAFCDLHICSGQIPILQLFFSVIHSE